MELSDKIDQLAVAIVAVQSAVLKANRDRENPYYKSTYATLNSVWDACREPLSKNGIAVVQCVTGCDKGRVGLTTMLLHSSGQWMRDTAIYTVAKDDPQGAGSAITYGRRYGFAAMLGVVTDEDDDGNAASHNPGTPAQPERTRVPATATPPSTDSSAF